MSVYSHSHTLSSRLTKTLHNNHRVSNKSLITRHYMPSFELLVNIDHERHTHNRLLFWLCFYSEMERKSLFQKIS